MNKIKKKQIIIPIITAIISLVLLLGVNYSFKATKDKGYVEFLNDLSKKKVSTVYFTDTPKIKIKLTDGKIYETDNPRIDNFKETLLQQGVEVSENAPSDVPYMILMASLWILRN